jgi:nicotinamide riboside transporter PnuC
MKQKVVFACQECGSQSGKWLGRCTDCGAWNSLVEERAVPAELAAAGAEKRYALAAAPVADSIGTWASLFATWLLARRVIDTWAWWIAIDAGLAALFARQGVWTTAALYLAYAVLAVAGWRQWRARRSA